MKLAVKPIYGWGWRNPDGGVAVPQPFELDVSVIEPGEPFRTAVGRIEATSHPLSGLWVLMSRRHPPADGEDAHVNLSAFHEKPVDDSVRVPRFTGYATVSVLQ